VYEWENGRCVPQILKLMNMAMYFGVSLDCILIGRKIGQNVLEEKLSRVAETEKPDDAACHPGELLIRFNALSDLRRERLIGYLDALFKEDKA